MVSVGPTKPCFCCWLDVDDRKGDYSRSYTVVRWRVVDRCACEGVGQLQAGFFAFPIFRTSGIGAVGMDGFAQLNRGPRFDSQFGLGILG